MDGIYCGEVLIVSARDELIVGGRELDELLKTLSLRLQKNISRSALRAGAAVMLQEVRTRIPVASGDLVRSARITTRARGTDISASVKVGNSVAWYAHLVEFGTRQHRISGKNGRALRFGNVTVQSVLHPGTRARPFMRPSAEAGFAAAIRAVGNKYRERLTKQGLNAPAPIPMDPET